MLIALWRRILPSVLQKHCPYETMRVMALLCRSRAVACWGASDRPDCCRVDWSCCCRQSNRLRLRYMSALVHYSVLHVHPIRPVYPHSQFHTAIAARHDPPLSLYTCTAETSTPVHVVDLLDGWVNQVCRFCRPGSAGGLSIHVRCRR